LIWDNFLPLDDQGSPLSRRGGMLGKVWLEIGTQWVSPLTL
jgi:hypothetical protein